VDLEKVEKAVKMLLEAIGEDPHREGLVDTPRRVARMYAELFSGTQQSPQSVLQVQFDENHQEMILVKDILLYSTCEHHLMPFIGKAHVAYIPRGKVVGISKLARVVDIFARRLQIQERLTSQIADALMGALEPQGVAVVIEAEHMCMAIRGVRKPGSKVVTSAVRGIFRSNAATRAEAFALIGQGHNG